MNSLAPVLQDLDIGCRVGFDGTTHFQDRNLSTTLIYLYGPHLDDGMQQDIAVQVNFVMSGKPMNEFPDYRTNLAFMIGTGIALLRPVKAKKEVEFHEMMQQICEERDLACAFIEGVMHGSDDMPPNDGSSFWRRYHENLKKAAFPEIDKIAGVYRGTDNRLTYLAGRSKLEIISMPVRLNLDYL